MLLCRGTVRRWTKHFLFTVINQWEKETDRHREKERDLRYTRHVFDRSISDTHHCLLHEPTALCSLWLCVHSAQRQLSSPKGKTQSSTTPHSYISCYSTSVRSWTVPGCDSKHRASQRQTGTFSHLWVVQSHGVTGAKRDSSSSTPRNHIRSPVGAAGYMARLYHGRRHLGSCSYGVTVNVSEAEQLRANKQFRIWQSTNLRQSYLFIYLSSNVFNTINHTKWRVLYVGV